MYAAKFYSVYHKESSRSYIYISPSTTGERAWCYGALFCIGLSHVTGLDIFLDREIIPLETLFSEALLNQSTSLSSPYASIF